MDLAQFRTSIQFLGTGLVKHFKDPPRRRKACDHVLIHAMESSDGFVEEPDEQDELHEFPQAHVTPHAPPGTDRQQNDQAHVAQETHERTIERSRCHHALVDALEAGTRAGMAAHETLVRELLATLVNSQDADDLAQNWSRIEAHFDTLFTTEDSIEALKQTVLELAVRGKLVRQNANEGSAKDLIGRISGELKRQQIGKRKNGNQSNLDNRGKWQLPPSWCWACLTELGRTSTGGTPKSSNADAFGGAKGEICCRSPLLWIDHFPRQRSPVRSLPRKHLAEFLLIDDHSQT
jgi:hypothetical protein